MSLVSVSAMMMKNLMAPINRNFRASFPWIGNKVVRASFHEKGFFVDAVAMVMSLPEVVASVGAEVAPSGALPSELPSPVLSKPSCMDPARYCSPDRVGIFCGSMSDTFLLRNAKFFDDVVVDFEGSTAITELFLPSSKMDRTTIWRVIFCFCVLLLSNGFFDSAVADMHLVMENITVLK